MTSPDLGWARGTAHELEEVVRQLPKEATRLKALQFAAALGVDKDEAYQNVDRLLLRGAPAELTRRIEDFRRANPEAGSIFFEPWQQLLLARYATSFGADEANPALFETPEGRALFLTACRYINDLSMPPAPPLTGDPVADALIVAAHSIPRMWMSNPPNLNDAIARLIIFLSELPRRQPSVAPQAAILRARFNEVLNVSFEETLALTGFMGYWSLAPTLEQLQRGLTAVQINPAAWLAHTRIPAETLNRLLERIAMPIDSLGDPPPPGCGNPWFDPLAFRNRPLVRLLDGSCVVTMPEFLMEKAGFEIFWWLTDGPGGQPQVSAWQAALGKLCEAYANELLSEIAAQSCAVFIPNLQWNDGELDALMSRADRLVVVEMSGGFLPNAPKMSGDSVLLHRALKRRYVEHDHQDGEIEHEAVSQLARDIAWLTDQRRNDGVADVALRAVNTIHPVLIAADRTVRTQGIWRYLDAELRQRLPQAMAWQVAPLAVMGLEDLEWVHQGVAQRHPRLTEGLAGLVQVLTWWQFEVDRAEAANRRHRYRALWQLLEDYIGDVRRIDRLRATFEGWQERTRREWFVT